MRWRLSCLFMALTPAITLAEEVRLPYVVRQPEDSLRIALDRRDDHGAKLAMMHLALRPSRKLSSHRDEPGYFIPDFQGAQAVLAQAPATFRASVGAGLEALARSAWLAILDPANPAELFDFTDRFGTTPAGALALERLG